jgi:hypothetical protein
MSSMGKRTVVVAGGLAGLAAVAVAAAVWIGGEAEDAPGPGDRAAVLVERLGCTDGEFASAPGAGWHEADVWDCLDDEVSGRVYGSLGPDEHDEAIRTLTAGGGVDDHVAQRCAEEQAGDELFLVDGDAWAAVVVGEAGAAAAAERLGGELQAEPLPARAYEDFLPFHCIPGEREPGGGGSGAGIGERAGDESAAAELSPSAAMAERLGCRSGYFTTADGGGWQRVDVYDCRDPLSAHIYGSLTTPQRDAAVRLLAIEAEREYDQPYDGCSDLGVSPAGGYVVAGDTWFAVVLGQEDATLVARLLDGQLQPGEIDTTGVTGLTNSCLP